jgi:pimeloyl-ACP methyl ester carboxylesterase
VFAALRPLLARAPRGDGHPVLVLPGFTADDLSTRPLRRFLRDLGYQVHGWRLGRNVGPTGAIVNGLRARFGELAERHRGELISLVGWSLGGIYAREIARSAPESVRLVITLGSPFRHTPGEESHPAAAVRAVARRRGVSTRLDQSPLLVPTTAIYTRTDGVVPWRASRDDDGERAESIEVVGSHSGLGHNPAVLWAIADRLAQPRGEWAPFRPTGPWRTAFPARRR